MRKHTRSHGRTHTSKKNIHWNYHINSLTEWVTGCVHWLNCSLFTIGMYASKENKLFFMRKNTFSILEYYYYAINCCSVCNMTPQVMWSHVPNFESTTATATAKKKSNNSSNFIIANFSIDGENEHICIAGWFSGRSETNREQKPQNEMPWLIVGFIKYWS